ncbi:MAG: putative universal stress protein (Usp) [Ramlibacter sp.]|jgi:nucleotide-binding universal stress UspA family protein|nr:putative universal stress protein (Usp) [Ramlibacter sp.]
MRQVLIPIDPSNEARTRSAVAEVVALHRAEPIGVRLLRVQPRLSGDVAMFFGTQELHRLQSQAGAEDLQFAEGLLAKAGVPFTSSVLVGRSAETIARAAREFGCDRIVFGDEGKSLATRVFGSLAGQVRHLLDPAEAQVLGS